MGAHIHLFRIYTYVVRIFHTIIVYDSIVWFSVNNPRRMKCVECTHLTFVSTPYHRDTHRENMEQIQSFAAMKIQRKTRLRAEIVCSNSYLIAKIKAVLSHSSGIRASCVACIVAFLCIQSKMSKNGTFTQSLWRIYSFITFLLFDAFSKKFFLSSTKRISIGIRM